MRPLDEAPWELTGRDLRDFEAGGGRRLDLVDRRSLERAPSMLDGLMVGSVSLGWRLRRPKGWRAQVVKLNSNRALSAE